MCLPSLKLTFSHLKMDGWNTSILLGWPIFRGYISFREGSHLILYVSSVVNFQGRKWIFYVFLCGYRADSRAEKAKRLRLETCCDTKLMLTKRANMI